MTEVVKSSFIIEDTSENIIEFLENPNIVVTFIEDSGRHREIMAEALSKSYFSIHDRIYSYKIKCVCKREKTCESVNSVIDNIWFTLNYKAILNYLEDKFLWNKR